MPLHIIKGPPNSGRTEELRSRYVESLAKRPVLVVPSTDDIFDWERRLMRDHGAFLGARIMHFKDLVAEVLESGPEERRRIAGPLRRHDLTVKALHEAWPGLARRVPRQPGLVDSLLDLFDELRGARITPEGLGTKLAGTDDADQFLDKVAATYTTYVKLLAKAALTDLPALASEAVGRPLDAWAGRPVFVAGFDDLTIQQLDLLEALAKVTEVTVAITFEKGNPAMAVTEGLLGSLQARSGVDELTTERASTGEHERLLYQIERGFMRDGTDGSLEPGEALTIIRSSGLRGEAEAVSAEIARLVDSGVAPGEIAVAVPSPSNDGGRFGDRLAEYGVNATVESETPATATSIGQAILDLLKAASPAGTAQDFVRFLRGPVPVDPTRVDSLERRVLCDAVGSAEEAADMLDGRDMPPGWLELKREGEDASAAVEAAINGMLGSLLDHHLSGDSRIRTETRIATAILRGCGELGEILGRPARPDEIEEALTGQGIKTWSVPDPESVVIASPYRLRAKRFGYLFMVSLQERGMGDPDLSGPFLTAKSRSAIELPSRKDAEDQELYLFYSCLSVPTKRLYLSTRIADETGTAEFPSPLVGSIERLFDDSTEPIRRIDRFASDVLFSADRAPSVDELARSLAASEAKLTPELELPAEVAEGVTERISTASDAESRTRTIGPISTTPAKSLLREITTFGPTSLEAYTECEYRWFVEKALKPSRFGPEPPAMVRGSLVHAVLADLYGRRKGRPGPDDLADWLDEVGPLVERLAVSRYGLGSDSAAHTIARTQSRLDIEQYIRREAGWETYRFEPSELETHFGGSEHPALEFEDWSLTGIIDRIDTRDGEAVIIDYKSGIGSVLSRANIEKEGKLQLQLYMLAVKRRWDLDPVASLYVPVCPGDGRPRGIISDEKANGKGKKDPDPKDLDDLNVYGPDLLSADALEGLLRQAEVDADDAVSAIHEGRIDHDPNRCVEHFAHPCIPPADLWESA